jgi:hypothetical protein
LWIMLFLPILPGVFEREQPPSHPELALEPTS